MSGGGDVPVPALVVAHDLIYVTNAHGRNSPMCAVEVMAEGELQLSAEDPQMRWFHPRRGNYMQTPLIYRGQAYFCSDSGIMTCFDALTGELHYRERLGDGNSGYSASAVAADGKVYVTSEEGHIHVLRAGAEYDPIATNEMNEICMATPAISEGVLYFRTRGHLVAIGRSLP